MLTLGEKAKHKRIKKLEKRKIEQEEGLPWWRSG